METIVAYYRALEQNVSKSFLRRAWYPGVIYCLAALAVQYFNDDPRGFWHDNSMHFYVLFVATWAYFITETYLNRNMLARGWKVFRFGGAVLVSFILSNMFIVATAIVSNRIFHNDIDMSIYFGYLSLWFMGPLMILKGLM